jgi:hypothetical protein
MKSIFVIFGFPYVDQLVNVLSAGVARIFCVVLPKNGTRHLTMNPSRKWKLAELLTQYSLAVSRLEWAGPAETTQHVATTNFPHG